MSLNSKMGQALLVPLRKRDGSARAWTVVSPEDYDRVMEAGRWSFSSRGCAYRRIGVGGKQIEVKLHRFILGLGRDDSLVDHRDRNPLNNTRSNLRLATSAENAQNCSSRGRSQYRGVSFQEDIQRWRAQHRLGGKRYHIGTFDTEEEAAEAARVWRRIYMPYAEE